MEQLFCQAVSCYFISTNVVDFSLFSFYFRFKRIDFATFMFLFDIYYTLTYIHLWFRLSVAFVLCVCQSQFCKFVLFFNFPTLTVEIEIKRRQKAKYKDLEMMNVSVPPSISPFSVVVVVGFAFVFLYCD